ncbi:MAG: hypothetical protein ACTSVO_10795 [Candidatus Heimdallarchaeaceae archaeon]
MQRKITISLALFISLLFIGLPASRALITTPITGNTIKAEDFQQTIFNADLNQENESLRNRPILTVEKSINGTPIQDEEVEVSSYLIRPNEWIRVNVTITNIGNETAYNLTIVDPSFEEWAVGNLNLTIQRYIQVDINATIFYFYYFQPKIEGNFTLESTSVDYINGTGIEYFSSSQRYNLFVETVEEDYKIAADLWLNILYFCLGVTGILGAIVLVDKYAIQKQHLIKPRKRSSLDVKKQKSKREEKKKIEKRR